MPEIIEPPDPTLEAADLQLVAAEEGTKPRGHLGISGIGGCPRKAAYQYYWTGSKPFNALTLKRFADGHRTEEVILERLRNVKELTVVDFIDDRQIKVDGYRNHFVGHLDFEVLGLLQAPKTWHVGEIKSVGDGNWKKFLRCKDKFAEKDVLKNWNETYFAQAQCYMKYRKRKRHWLVVTEAGGRDWNAVRTDYDAEAAQGYEDLAKRIVDEPNGALPDRISENSGFFMCNYMCEFKGICHEKGKVERNCRTCVWSTPSDKGRWMCHRHERLLSYDEQLVGCSDQRFRESLVPGELISFDREKNEARYLIGKKEWTDGGANAE